MGAERKRSNAVDADADLAPLRLPQGTTAHEAGARRAAGDEDYGNGRRFEVFMKDRPRRPDRDGRWVVRYLIWEEAAWKNDPRKPSGGFMTAAAWKWSMR